MEGETQAKQLVDDLYEMRDDFVNMFGLKRVPEKPKLLQDKMNETLKSLRALETTCRKTTFMLEYSRALNVLPEYNSECEDFLAKVVKRDPSLTQAWNMLGETFWKKGEVGSARNCFECALNRNKDKVSLRSLSMVMRQMKAEKAGDDLKNIFASVELAKDAVQLDLDDGSSWYILGNAYLSLFFATEQNPKVLTLALSAYSRAEAVDQKSTNNPDLHFNRAQAYRYMESYKLCLEGWQTALCLDPTWSEPQTKIAELIDFLDKVSTLVHERGKLKNRRIQTLMKSINANNLGPYQSGILSPEGERMDITQKTLSSLQDGVNKETVVCGRVVCNLANLTLVPFTFVMIDSEGTPVAVTVYNLEQSRGVIIGDAVAIPEPSLTRHAIEWTDGGGVAHAWEFPCIKVANPAVLVVNGKQLTHEHCAFTRASYNGQ